MKKQNNPLHLFLLAAGLGIILIIGIWFVSQSNGDATTKNLRAELYDTRAGYYERLDVETISENKHAVIENIEALRTQLEELKKGYKAINDKETTKDIENTINLLSLATPIFQSQYDSLLLAIQSYQSVFEAEIAVANNEMESKGIQYSLEEKFTSLNENKKALIQKVDETLGRVDIQQLRLALQVRNTEQAAENKNEYESIERKNRFDEIKAYAYKSLWTNLKANNYYKTLRQQKLGSDLERKKLLNILNYKGRVKAWTSIAEYVEQNGGNKYSFEDLENARKKMIGLHKSNKMTKKHKKELEKWLNSKFRDRWWEADYIPY